MKQQLADDLNSREINAMFWGFSHGAQHVQVDRVMDRIEGDPSGVKALVKRLISHARKTKGFGDHSGI